MTDRPSMLATLVGMNELMALRSTCNRGTPIAASAVIDDRIVSTGYRGAPKGMPHCEHLEWTQPEWPFKYPSWVHAIMHSQNRPMMGLGDTLRVDRDGRGHEQITVINAKQDPATAPTCLISVHAEANMIAFAARRGIALAGATVITSQSPCLTCAKLLINVGIVKVVAVKMYRDSAGVDLLRDATIDVVTP